MDVAEHVSSVYDYLPDYVCGAMWLVDIGIAISAAVTLGAARTSVRSLTVVLADLKVPEVVIGFLVAIVGIVLPYAMAVVLNPLSVSLSNLSQRWFGPRSLPYAQPAHSLEALRRAGRLFGLKPPTSYTELLLLPYLEHIKSSTVPSLRTHGRVLYVQGRLVLPISLFAGLVTYLVFGQGLVALAIALPVSLAALIGATHSTNVKLMAFSDRVAFAFLAVTGETENNTAVQRRSGGPPQDKAAS